MIYAYIGITVLWIFYFCYIIVSIDFGAGFSLYILELLVKRRINHLIHRYLSSVGSYKCFLRLFFVGFIGFFCKVFGNRFISSRFNSINSYLH